MAYVLDTSAVMRLLLDESGAEEVQRILEGDEPVALPFISVMELQYQLLRRLPPQRVGMLIEMLRSSCTEVPESTPEWGRRAAEIKARGGLSLADAWVAALALMRGARLVHQDAEFYTVAGLQHHPLAPPPD